MNPRYPLYIVSKGRWQHGRRLTARSLESMHVPYYIIIEASEYNEYAEAIDREKILILDPAYQRDYDTCDELGDTKSKGPGPARNFAWDHALSQGAAWHWVMDDNIRGFWRMNKNRKHRVLDGTFFRVMEDFCLRYTNIAMAGPQYFMFQPRISKAPPLIINTRIYSCNLIRNDIPFRWRGRYNEDTDLSLRILKAGWCTVLFKAWQQQKIWTQQIKGGNMQDFYEREGTLYKSRMQVQLHPDVSRMVWKFNRWHHVVDYRPFRRNRLERDPAVEIPAGTNEYGLSLVSVR